MSTRRKIEDEAEARRCLLAIETEGWDIRTWARAHGVDGRSLHGWQVNLARVGTKLLNGHAGRGRAALATTGRLVELVPTAPSPRSLPRVGRYVLEVGGARVEFGDDFSEPTLRRIVDVLRSC
jgi:hypothetical protein